MGLFGFRFRFPCPSVKYDNVGGQLSGVLGLGTLRENARRVSSGLQFGEGGGKAASV